MDWDELPLHPPKARHDPKTIAVAVAAHVAAALQAVCVADAFEPIPTTGSRITGKIVQLHNDLAQLETQHELLVSQALAANFHHDLPFVTVSISAAAYAPYRKLVGKVLTSARNVHATAIDLASLVQDIGGSADPSRDGTLLVEQAYFLITNASDYSLDNLLNRTQAFLHEVTRYFESAVIKLPGAG